MKDRMILRRCKNFVHTSVSPADRPFSIINRYKISAVVEFFFERAYIVAFGKTSGNTRDDNFGFFEHYPALS